MATSKWQFIMEKPTETGRMGKNATPPEQIKEFPRITESQLFKLDRSEKRPRENIQNSPTGEQQIIIPTAPASITHT